jgi:hypothetical protein
MKVYEGVCRQSLVLGVQKCGGAATHDRSLSCMSLGAMAEASDAFSAGARTAIGEPALPGSSLYFRALSGACLCDMIVVIAGTMVVERPDVLHIGYEAARPLRRR